MRKTVQLDSPNNMRKTVQLDSTDNMRKTVQLNDYKYPSYDYNTNNYNNNHQDLINKYRYNGLNNSKSYATLSNAFGERQNASNLEYSNAYNLPIPTKNYGLNDNYYQNYNNLKNKNNDYSNYLNPTNTKNMRKTFQGFSNMSNSMHPSIESNYENNPIDYGMNLNIGKYRPHY